VYGFIELAFKSTMKSMRSYQLLLMLEKAAATHAEFLKRCHSKLLPFTLHGPVNSGVVIFFCRGVFILETCTTLCKTFSLGDQVFAAVNAK